MRKAIIKPGRGKRKGQFYALLVADNGEPLGHTEHSSSKSALKKTIKKYFPDFEIVEE
jgi:hypothetical protein